MNRQLKYTPEVKQALSLARDEAQRLRHRLIGPEHLLLGILKMKDPLIDGVFTSLRVSSTRVIQALDFVVSRGTKAILSEPTLNPASRMIMERAGEMAAQAEYITLAHVFLSIFDERNSLAMSAIESFGIQPENARLTMEVFMHGDREEILLMMEYQTRYDATPMLNEVSRDITLAALHDMLDPFVGRDEILERVMQVLSRRSKNNPVLIGPSGVGKTAIVEGLAQRIVNKQVPENLLGCRVVVMDISMLTVGTKFRGDFEERLKQIMQEIMNNEGIIVVIDDLHLLVKSGVSEGSLDAANLFKPVLARGEFRCIGTTTSEDYRKTIEADPALERRFQPVQVAETTYAESLAVLKGLRSHYEEFHHVTITNEALAGAVRISSRYIQDRHLPDKAIDVIDEAASFLAMQRSLAPDSVLQARDQLLIIQREKEYAINQHNFPHATLLFKRESQLRQQLWQAEADWREHQVQQRPVVGEQEIAHVVSRWTGIPVTQLMADEMQRLLGLEQHLHQRVIGQHEAVQAVARAVRRSRTDMRDSHRPIGSFVFVGPTGVGKTELARALAEALFGDENALIPLDMSEFMASHHAARLLGAPPGYAGHEQAGQLTEAVKRRPYSVVLFDEVEKAHPQIFDLLLQVLEEGCLTDAQGQRVDFRNTMIIMTSNAGMQYMTARSMSFSTGAKSEQQLHQEAQQNVREHALTALRTLFRPELLNRIDDIIVFHRLQQEQLREITDIMIAHLQRRLADRSITLKVSSAASSLLARRGYNLEYGARQLRRTVQHLLEDMLAEAILQGTVADGDMVLIDVMDAELHMQVQENEPYVLANASTHEQYGAA